MFLGLCKAKRTNSFSDLCTACAWDYTKWFETIVLGATLNYLELHTKLFENLYSMCLGFNPIV
jgi:hypothetical protein